MIKELMHPIEKTTAGSSKSRQLNLVVFLRLGHAPVVIISTGSDYPNMPVLKEYIHGGKKNKKYVKLGMQEYMDCITTAIPQLRGRGARVGGLRSSTPVVLVHDEATPHKAKKVGEFAANFAPVPIRLIQLPTASPDLTPCDSCFFAAVKNEWQRQTVGKGLSWERRVQLALKLTREQDPDGFIKALPSRWKACEAEKGGHIELGLARGKKQ